MCLCVCACVIRGPNWSYFIEKPLWGRRENTFDRPFKKFKQKISVKQHNPDEGREIHDKGNLTDKITDSVRKITEFVRNICF